MKIRVLFILLAAAVFPSCDAIKDLFRTDIETEFEMTIPVVVTETAIATKSGSSVTSYSYNKSHTFSLSENDDLDDYLDRIKEIDLQNLSVEIFGLQAGQEIESLTISASGVGTVVTLNNLTPSSGKLSPTVSQDKLNEVAATLKDNNEVTVTVNGSSNYAPMSFNVNLAMDAIVEAGL